MTNQSCPRNMSIPFKSVTAASSCSLCLLILISRGATLVTSPFFVPYAWKTLNEKLIGFIWIHLSLTNCLLILMCMHPESTNTLTLKFFPFFILTFACTFNSFLVLLYQLGIIYLFWEFTGKIFSKTLFLIFFFVVFIIQFFLNLLFCQAQFILGVKVHKMNLELCRLVEQPWLQLMCCAVCLLYGCNFRW